MGKAKGKRQCKSERVSTEYGVRITEKTIKGTGWLEYGVQGKGLKKSTEYGKDYIGER